MRRRVLALILVATAWSTLSAQQPSGRATDESQLGFYLGRWSEEGQSRATPSGGFSKLTGEESCSWFSGGPNIVCRETTRDGNSETDALYILSYDRARKGYSIYGTDNLGAIYSGTGTIDASGVWRWTVESRRNGVTTPMRYAFKTIGGGSRSMEVEVSTAKGVWARLATVTYKPAR